MPIQEWEREKEERDLGEIRRRCMSEFTNKMPLLAEAMRTKLARGGEKGKGHWEHIAHENMLCKLLEEVGELNKAVAVRNNEMFPTRQLVREIAYEAADVALLAFMIADNAGAFDDYRNEGRVRL